MSRFALGLLAVPVVLLFAGCTADPVHRSSLGGLTFGLAGFEVDAVARQVGEVEDFAVATLRARVRVAGTTDVLLDRVIAAPALDARGEGQVSLTFPLPKSGPVPFEADIELRNAAGTTLWQVGPARFELPSGGGPAALNASATYVGPGADLSAVRFEQSQVRIPPGGTTTARCIGTRSGGSTIEKFPRRWTSSDPTIASVDDAGSVRGVAVGLASITCRADTGLPLDAATMAVIVSAAPSRLEVASGGSQTSFPGDPLVDPLLIRAADAAGRGVPGVVLRFRVSSGGAVENATSVTDALGLASTGRWTLGDVGTNTLTVESDEVSTITVPVETRNPCERVLPLTLGASASGTLTPTRSCLSPNFVNAMQAQYDLTLTSPATLSISMTSSAFNPTVFLRYPDGVLIAGRSVATRPLSLIAPAGMYRVDAVAGSLTTPGAFTLSADASGETQVGCQVATIVVPGVTFSGTVTADDCLDPANGNPANERRYDSYVVYLRAGESITVTATANFPHHFSHWVGSTRVGGWTDAEAGQTRTWSYTATTAGNHSLYMLNRIMGQFGSYTMTIAR